MRLIPIHNKPPFRAFGNYIPVDGGDFTIGLGQVNLTGLYGHPPRARQTILRGVDRCTGPLSGEIGQEEVNRRLLRGVAINPLNEVPGTQDFSDIVRDRDICP